METEDIARDIYDYMCNQLAEGVYIEPKREKEMLREIEFMIDTD